MANSLPVEQESIVPEERDKGVGHVLKTVEYEPIVTKVFVDRKEADTIGEARNVISDVDNECVIHPHRLQSDKASNKY